MAALCVTGGAAAFGILRGLAPVFAALGAALGIIAGLGHSWVSVLMVVAVAIVGLVTTRLALDTPRLRIAVFGSLVASVGFTVAGIVLAVIGVATATSIGEVYGPSATILALAGSAMAAFVLLRTLIQSYRPLADVVAAWATVLLLGAAVVFTVPGASPAAVLTAAAGAGCSPVGWSPERWPARPGGRAGCHCAVSGLPRLGRAGSQGHFRATRLA